jgi:DNA repair protein RadC
MNMKEYKESENYNRYVAWIAETHDRHHANSPDNAVSAAITLIDDTMKEYFILLSLDTKNKIISKNIISVGSLNANIVHPREVFKAAIISSAAHIIVLHNHPSGDPTPSREDIEITKKLADAGKIISINVLDHVIIGAGRNYSLKEAGHIE